MDSTANLTCFHTFGIYSFLACGPITEEQNIQTQLMVDEFEKGQGDSWLKSII